MNDDVNAIFSVAIGNFTIRVNNCFGSGLRTSRMYSMGNFFRNSVGNSFGEGEIVDIIPLEMCSLKRFELICA